MPEPKGFLIVPIGFRADGTLRALELTDSDELKVALATATGSDLLTELEAKLETADLELVSKILSIGSHGWIGAAWQRQPVILGYSGDKSQQIWTENSIAGTQAIHMDTVPLGEIWDVQLITCKNMNTECTYIQIMVIVNGISMTLLLDNDPVIATDTNWNGHIILSYLDRVSINYAGCALNDDLYTRFHAVKIDIDQ